MKSFGIKCESFWLTFLAIGTVMECYGYDAEFHADNEIASWTNGGQPPRDAATSVTRVEADKLADWFLAPEHKFKLKL